VNHFWAWTLILGWREECHICVTSVAPHKPFFPCQH